MHVYVGGPFGGPVDKTLLRAEMRAALAGLSPRERAQGEDLVNAALVSDPVWRDAGTVLVFKAKAPELSVVSATNAAFRAGKAVAFPRVAGGDLVLHRVSDWTALAPGAFGIEEPSPQAPTVDPDDVDMAVVPGLAWTRDGDRLGQGGGFYDRLLPRVAGATVGVGFDRQLLGGVPLEPHDVAVDRVMTPSLVLGT